MAGALTVAVVVLAPRGGRLGAQRFCPRRSSGRDPAAHDHAAPARRRPPLLPADPVGALDAADDDALVQHLSVRLYGVWGSGAGDVYAVGENGTILHLAL